MDIRFIDLFAGIGGFRLGLTETNKDIRWGQDTEGRQGKACLLQTRDKSQLGWLGVQCAEGFRCVWSCEIDKWCEQVYRRNFGEGFDAHDVGAVDASTIPDFDLLASGFPCQSFSIAGKRRGFADTRGTLFFDICRILRAKRPRLLLLENVKGLLSDDEGRTFLTILKSLDELGYDLQWEVLNSKNFGVPQNRERVFIVGHLRGTPRPQVFPLGEDGQVNVCTQGEAQGNGARLRYAGALSHRYGKDGGECLIAHALGIGGSFEMANYIAPAIRAEHHNTTDVHFIGELPELRRLTPLECERLQGFPDGWTEGVSDTQRYRMLGNAVTVNVVEAIGKKLMEVLV